MNVDKKVEKYMAEAKRTRIEHGKYLRFPDNSLSSIPSLETEDSTLVFSSHRGSLHIAQKRNGNIYGDFGDRDYLWKDMEDFVEWLNGPMGRKWAFIGVDDGHFHD